MERDDVRFEECFERNYRDVARFCARRTSSPEDAEDAATEVFATAWRRLDALPAPPEDRLWLFAVARRVLANAQRAEHRRSRLTERLVATAQAATVPPPDARAEAAALAEALGRLSPADRELLLLTGWEELSPAQIATVLGRPAPLISRRLHRARARLARHLQAVGALEAAAGAPAPRTS